MISVEDYAAWRTEARRLLRQGIPPEEVIWSGADEAQDLLFEPETNTLALPSTEVLIPKAFLKLAEIVACHSNPRRWSMLYRVAWRLSHGERHLLEVDLDDDVAALHAMRRAVEKDTYRMRQFVRFRKLAGDDGERFVAWYQPEHHTLHANAQFFLNRFGSMRWAILTPQASLIWDLQKLETGPGVSRSQAPQEDELEDLWRLYYQTIYNPARLKLKAMRAQLPVRNWNNLPEAQTIPDLVRLSRGRVQQMADAQPQSASRFIPLTGDLQVLRESVLTCGACDLCRRATQPVWGEGTPDARVMLVGEQPGDEEDLAGRPFVGPAGQVLNAALDAAGVARRDLYVTNAVKAFKFEERGKRRIHQTPRSSEIVTCRPWLMAEMEIVRPSVIVCLGASAALSVLGRKVQIAAERGKCLPLSGAQAFVSYHPSAILRAPEKSMQQELFKMLVSDLALANSASPFPPAPQVSP